MPKGMMPQALYTQQCIFLTSLPLTLGNTLHSPVPKEMPTPGSQLLLSRKMP